MTGRRDWFVAVADQAIRLFGEEAIWRRIAAFYEPYHTLLPEPPGPIAATVVASLDATPADHAPCSALHRYVAGSIPERIAADIDFHRRPSGTSVRCDHRRREVMVKAVHPDELHLELRILLRDQIILPLERAAGWTMLHAACVERNGQAILLTGERHSGKTTGMLTLLSTGNYNLIASDRVKLKRAPEGGVQLRGHVANTNLHRRTVESDPLLAPLVAELTDRYDDENKASVSSQRLAALSGCRVVADGRPVIVFFPNVDANGPTSAEIELIPSEVMVECLMANTIVSGSISERARWLGLIPPVANEGRAEARRTAAALAERCVGYSVSGTHSAVVAAFRRPEWGQRCERGTTHAAPHDQPVAI